MPVRFFGVSLGAAGLALAWMRAGTANLLPWASDFSSLLYLACVVCLLTILGYCLKAALSLSSVKADLYDPALVTFVAAAPMTLMLLAAGLHVVHPELGVLLHLLWAAGVVGHLGLATWLVFRWSRNTGLLGDVTPAWFVPTIGIIVAPFAGVPLGYWALSAGLLALGTLAWFLMAPLAIARIIKERGLSAPLLPTLFVLIAPSSLIALALDTLDGPPLISTILAGISWVVAAYVAIALGINIRAIRHEGFHLGWWGATFPLAALASASVFLYATTLTVASYALAVAGLALASIAFATVSVLTILRPTPQR